MSRKNHIHLADAFIYGYSNFTFIPPIGTTTTAVRSEVANAPMAFEKVNRFTKIPTPVYIAPDVISTPIIKYEEERTFVPIIDIINPTPVYVKPDAIPTVTPSYEDDVRPPAPTPAPIPVIPIVDIINSSPTVIAEDDGRKPITPSPIVNIINPSPYVAPPLIVGGGAGGGGAMGGGKPLSGSANTKPSFIKKNFIPILLIATAIYVFIKKPIK